MHPTGRRLRAPLRVGLVILGTAALLVGAALLGVPELLGLPSVKAGVERKLSQAAGGHLAFEALRVRLLPAPHADMRGVAIDIPERVHARIERARVGLSLRALLQGQVQFTSIAVLRPIVRLDLAPPAPAQAQRQTATDPVAEYRSAMGSLVQAVHTATPGVVFEISDAQAILRAAAMPELQLRDLSVRVRVDSSGLDLVAGAAANLWDRLHLTGRVEFADLSGHFGLDVTGLDAKFWLDDWFSGGWLGMEIPRGDVRVRMATDARSELRCDFDIHAASLRLVHAAQRLPVSASRLKGTAVLRAQEIEVIASELQIGSLIPAGRVQLKMTSDAEKPRLEVDLPRLEVGAVRDFVTTLAVDSPGLHRGATRALAGAIMDLRMRSQGDTWHALIRLDHLAGGAMLEHASVQLPVIEQKAKELKGQITLDRANIELARASARLGPAELTDASVRYAIRDGAVAAGVGFELDLTHALDFARSALPQEARSALDDVDSVQGNLRGHAGFGSTGRNWDANFEISRSSASVRMHALPWPVSLQAARASISPEQVSVSDLQLLVGSSKFSDVGATVALIPQARLTSGSGRAVLVLDQIYPWLRSYRELADRLADIDSVSGSVAITLKSLSGALGRPSALAFDANVLPEQVRVGLKGWPELVIAGGAAHIDTETIALDRVSVATLDAQGLVSGRVVGYRGNDPQVQASVADAVAGEQSMHRIWQRTGAPEQFEPRTPLRFALAQATWSPNGAIEAQAGVTFEAGPELTLHLRRTPDTLDIRRLVIRDRASNARFRLRALADLLEAEFSGSISASTIAAMFKRGGEFQGQASGDLRVRLDLERRGRTSFLGRVTAQGLDLDELLPPQARAQARVDRLDVAADGSSVLIREAAVSWAQQSATIHGEIARSDNGVVVDLEIASPGVAVDALRRGSGVAAPQAAATEDETFDARRAELFSWLRELGVTGHIKLQSDFVAFERYRLAPVRATLALGPEQVELHLEETQLCGLAVPMTVQMVPTGLTASVQIQARKQQLEQVARCLSEQRVLLTGEFDASATLTTQGDPGELLTNLQGSVHLESRNGVVRKFALIGNIMSMKDVAGLLIRRLPDLGAEGFPYLTLDIDGHFSQGRFIVEDFTFDSSAFGLAAEGSIGLAKHDTQLTALVAPFNSLTDLIRKVPVVGFILGRTLTSIPASVRGDIRDPTVVPFDPRAITSHLTAVFTHALKIPERVLAPFESSPTPPAASGGR